jgi:hypothetical protein
MSPMEVVARVQAAASAAGIATPPAAESAGDPAPTPEPVTAPVSERTSGTAPPSIVQRLPGDSDGGQPTTTSTSSNADAANPTTPDDPGQLDELARRLYPRFRTLLADRERSGRIFDVR